MTENAFRLDRRMKTTIAVAAVIAFMTLSVFAVGFTALERAEAEAAASGQKVQNAEEGAALSAFKWV